MNLKLSDFNPRYLLDSRRYLLLSVGALLVAAGLLIFGIIPQVQAALDLSAKQTAETQKLEALSKKAQELENLNSSPVAQQIQTVEKVLPSKKPLLELLTSLNFAAQESQVNISTLSLSPGSIATDSASPTKTPATKKAKRAKSAVTDTLDVNLTVTGQLEDINRFFETIEKRAPLTTISSMALAKKSNLVGSFAGQFEAKLTITAYYFVQSVSSAVETSLPPVTSQQQTLLEDLAGFILPTDAQQLEIQGGGLNDLFGIDQPEIDTGT